MTREDTTVPIERRSGVVVVMDTGAGIVVTTPGADAFRTVVEGLDMTVLMGGKYCTDCAPWS